MGYKGPTNLLLRIMSPYLIFKGDHAIDHKDIFLSILKSSEVNMYT